MYATNGRAYLQQIETESGTWFLDARRPTNHPRALTGWHGPEALKEMLGADEIQAQAALKAEPTDYLGLRDYQLKAVRAVEEAIGRGQRSILLAMATGTGKTRTIIGLIYRLLKSRQCRRVLFLVTFGSIVGLAIRDRCGGRGRIASHRLENLADSFDGLGRLGRDFVDFGGELAENLG